MLPKIDHPLFTTTLPISKIEIKFRPLLVKEEKLLLLAKESNDLDFIISIMHQVIKNTVHTTIDINKLSIIDVQWIFMQLRIQSIGKIIRCSVTDPIDKKEYSIEIDLTEIYVKPDKVQETIRLSDNLVLQMKLPGMSDIKNVATISTDFTSLSFNLILNCIVSVFDGDTEYSNFTQTELEEFIDSLNSTQIQAVTDYFNNLPKLTMKYSYTTVEGELREWEVDKFQDFFI